MCSSLEQLKTKTTSPSSSGETETNNFVTGVIGGELSFSVLLEFAADNDVEGFQRSTTTSDVSLVGEVGLWYGRRKCSKHIVMEHRTPLMIAAKYGSVDFVKLILSLSEVDVNLFCGPDRSTALHCAASGGSIRAVEVVRLLLLAGADPCITDANGHLPFDDIAAPWNMPQIKVALEELLNDDGSVCLENVQESTINFRSALSSLSSSLDSGSKPLVSDENISVVTCKPTDNIVSSGPESKVYPVDPSIPDIKSSTYGTDDFRMFSLKIQPCSRAYSHDWTECPFVHPGENARRRDPRKFPYNSVPCPDFRKGTCKRGDSCEYAHGVFESWLHPTQYRTRLCKDGITCNRRVCFFAHRPEELRTLHVSSGSSIHSPQSAASAVTAIDNAAAMNLLPGSLSMLPAISMSPFSPIMSPYASGNSQAPMGWPQQHAPTLHLPGSNLQANRLRFSVNSRDMTTMELNMPQDFEMYQQQHPLDELFPTGVSAQKSVLLNQLHQQKWASPIRTDIFSPMNDRRQRVLSPIKTNIFSPKADHPLLWSAFDASLPEKSLPWNVEPLSPLNSQSAFPILEKQQQSFRSLSSWQLGCKLSDDFESKSVGSLVNSWSKGKIPNDKVDWPAQKDELGQFHEPCSTGHHGVESAVSRVESGVKESPSGQITAAVADRTVSGEGSNSNSPSKLSDNATSLAWNEQLQLDE